jgi:hypothetical protein
MVRQKQKTNYVLECVYTGLFLAASFASTYALVKHSRLERQYATPAEQKETITQKNLKTKSNSNTLLAKINE